MTHTCFDVTLEDKIGHVVLNRPQKRNSMISYSRDHSTSDALDYVAIWNASMMQREEVVEAMAANAEKRSGDFVDLPSRQRELPTS